MTRTVNQTQNAASLEAMAGTPYSIRITNNSQLDGHSAIVFQKDPGLPEDVHTLAWLAKMCHPSSRVAFNWTIDYNFVWGQQGNLRPGTSYEAGQEVAASLTQSNVINLSYIDGGFEFGKPTNGTTGALLITEDNTVPGAGNPNIGCVGIGMSGAGTFVAPTQTSYELEFQPHPEYWIAFGRYDAGVVVDESGMTVPQAVQFGKTNFNADCVFDGSSWDITYS